MKIRAGLGIAAFPFDAPRDFFAFARAEPVRLDESPTGDPVTRAGDTLRFAVPAHALRSVRIE